MTFVEFIRGGLDSLVARAVRNKPAEFDFDGLDFVQSKYV